MIGALLVLLPVVGVVAWAFFRFAPIHANRTAMLRFNVASVTVALLLAGAWGVRTYLVMSPMVDAAWWPVIAVLGGLIVVPVVLCLAAILRHFIVFRRVTGSSRQ